jgi:hypothetical protein
MFVMCYCEFCFMCSTCQVLLCQKPAANFWLSIAFLEYNLRVGFIAYCQKSEPCERSVCI